MDINLLSTFAAFILGVSMATERVVAIFKTFCPALADEKKNDAQEVDLVADRPRRIKLQLLAIIAAWLTSAFLAGEGNFAPFANVKIDGGIQLPAWVLAILASGGAAFWKSVIEYASAVKDLRTQQRATESLSFHKKAQIMGVQAVDGGMAASKAQSRDHVARIQEYFTTTSGNPQPNF